MRPEPIRIDPVDLIKNKTTNDDNNNKNITTKKNKIKHLIKKENIKKIKDIKNSQNKNLHLY